jgi:hypothetical protein
MSTAEREPSGADSCCVVGTFDRRALTVLLDRYRLDLVLCAPEEPIPSSYWGGREAGLKGERLFARLNTPVHSVLHEAAHFICMSPERRAGLDRDAGGDDLEEAAVCYLQIVLADALPRIGKGRLCADMDAWGYSFRLGSAGRWFAEDAEDARAWLIAQGIIDTAGEPTGALRC